MADSDEELYITQNSFISTEIAEGDVISGDDGDIEERFDCLLDNAEIEEQIHQSVASATRYKDEWAVWAFEFKCDIESFSSAADIFVESSKSGK